MSETCCSTRDLGIIDLEFYTPCLYVDQTELEEYDQVSQGKYTIGLGLSQMAVASDLEDVNSLCMTVTRRMLAKHPDLLSRLGRLEVGTESQIDKSKSVKSNLLRLFDNRKLESDNDDDNAVLDAEGVDCINACFGGTQALFNALNWLESSACRGRLALVVMGDIATYASGPARCTGGAGALALLLGPGAPIVFQTGTRATAMRHSYDFYKPMAMNSEYALFDGASSVRSYITSLDTCYTRYKKLAGDSDLRICSFSHVLFHCPYSKLVEKSLARLHLLDERAHSENGPLTPYKKLSLDELINNKECERACVRYAKPLFEQVTSPSLSFSRRCGNMYTPSLYSGLLSILAQVATPESLHGRTFLLFSYGSGSCSAMFSARVQANTSQLHSRLEAMCQVARRELAALDTRHKLSPQQFTDVLMQREQLNHSAAPGNPSCSPSSDYLRPGTYYLTEIDAMYRREYALFQ